MAAELDFYGVSQKFYAVESPIFKPLKIQFKKIFNFKKKFLYKKIFSFQNKYLQKIFEKLKFLH